jgi:hypothetical protein
MAVRQGPYSPKALIQSDACFVGPSFLTRREVWQEHRGGISHDLDNWLRVEEACWRRGWTLAHVDEVLCDYRRGDWNACVRRPDMYDAPKWRALAEQRRAYAAGTWLGDLIRPRVRPNDDVLDLGCGIMPATGGRLTCRRHVGVDAFAPYLDLIGPPTVLGRLPGACEPYSPLKVFHHQHRLRVLRDGRAAGAGAGAARHQRPVQPELHFCAYRWEGYTSNELFKVIRPTARSTTTRTG